MVPANPFTQACNHPQHPLMNGPVPASAVLPIHIRILAAVRARLAAVFITLPRDASLREIPGYRSSLARAASEARVNIIDVPNNTLGSYGMYLHAFATTRGRFDYYVMCEADYVPAHPDFVGELLRMHSDAFPDGKPGVLAGILQGRPIEPKSKFQLHLEGAHIMSTASLEHLYRYTYGTNRWRHSMAARMLHLVNSSHSLSRLTNTYYFGLIQEGFGLLLSDAGIAMRDWTAHFRSPYWNHEYVHDWSAAASNFTLRASHLMAAGLTRSERPALAATGALFLPVQWLMLDTSFLCCIPFDKFCKMRAACSTPTSGLSTSSLPPAGCCKRKKDSKLLTNQLLQVRALASVPRGGYSELCAMGERGVLRHSLSVAAAREIARAEANLASEVWTEERNRMRPLSEVEKGAACASGLIQQPRLGAASPWVLRTLTTQLPS